jgi:hypothetical protein
VISGEQAIEDIIPDWIATKIGWTPPFTVDYFDDVRDSEAKRRFGGSMASEQLKLRGVCASRASPGPGTSVNCDSPDLCDRPTAWQAASRPI